MDKVSLHDKFHYIVRRNKSIFISISYYDIVIHMIKSIKNQTTQDIFDGFNSKAARKIPFELHKIVRRKLDLINSVESLDDLKVPPGNHLEILRGDRKGFYSIRVNQQWRIVFRWESGQAQEVQVVDYY